MVQGSVGTSWEGRFPAPSWKQRLSFLLLLFRLMLIW